MQDITRRAALTSPADPPFIPPRMRAPDPVMLLLNRFEGICEMIDSNAWAWRTYEASDCLEPEEKPGVEAALKSASEASHRRLSNAQIELFGMRATSYEGVLKGEKIFDANVFDTRLTWQFSVRSFVRLTIQSSDVSRNPDVYIEPVDARTRNIGRQLLYSYKINPQTVFFLGYSDQYVDEDDLDGLTASGRSWFMKIGYAWNL